MRIQKSYEQIVKRPMDSAQIHQEYLNQRAGNITAPQLSAAQARQFDEDFLAKRNAESQRIKEGEEAFSRTAREGSSYTKWQDAKDKQKKAEEDAKMEAFIARRRGQRKENLENQETLSRINRNIRGQ